MEHAGARQTSPQSQPKPLAASAARLSHGRTAELLYDHISISTSFAVWDGNTWSISKQVQNAAGEHLVPYSPRNNLLQNGVVLLPSTPEEYSDTRTLFEEVRSFIHRYVDVSPLYERIASSYVLFSWVYDAFNELPYLRLQGEPGSGKSRFLLTVGALCYKPIFASGASTISPLFRILDAFRGTLIIDESDFRQSDERAEMTKILNNGNVRGFPVLRSEVSPSTKEFNPRAYAVFGPKIVATRGLFEDRALESRFLSEPMGERPLRSDIPINLPPSHQEEALRLRNKLLLFRFKNLHRVKVDESLVDRSIEPRLSQILVPLLSTIDDAGIRDELKGLARTYHRQMVNDRGMDPEAHVLEVLREMRTSNEQSLSLKDLTAAFISRFGEEYERAITPKWIGHLLRTKLHLNPHKRHGIYILSVQDPEKLDRLFARYGILPPDSTSPSPHVPASEEPVLLPDVPKSPQCPPAP